MDGKFTDLSFKVHWNNTAGPRGSQSEPDRTPRAWKWSSKGGISLTWDFCLWYPVQGEALRVVELPDVRAAPRLLGVSPARVPTEHAQDQSHAQQHPGQRRKEEKEKKQKKRL